MDRVPSKEPLGARAETFDQTASGVAHDLNNLLAVILNYATLIADAVPDDAEVQSDVQQILSASARAARLTQQLQLLVAGPPEP